MNHPFPFIKSRVWLYFVHWSLWMSTLDEMRMKTAFTPFTLDESPAMHIQSVKCKFALTVGRVRGKGDRVWNWACRHDWFCRIYNMEE
jgi:hypothetical protein